MSICLRTLLAVVLACGAIASTSVAATPMAEHVPEDALVYVGWRGAADAPDGFEQTHLKGFLDETQFGALLTRTLPQLLEHHGGNDPEVAQMREMLGGLWPILWERPWALYLAGVDTQMMDQGAPPMPLLGLIVATDGDDDELRQRLEQLRMIEPPVEIVEGDGYLGVVTTPDAAPVADGGLAASDRLDAALAPLSDDAVAVGYVDLAGVLALVREQAEMHGNPDDVDEMNAFVETLGLDGVQSAAMTAGFAGPMWEMRVFLNAPAPRRGLVEALLASEPIEDEHLALAPATSTWFSASRLDLANLYDRGRELVEQIEPAAQAEIDEALFMASAMTGVDIEADLLRGLGPVWIAYRDSNVAGPTSWLGIALANPLREPERVDRAMQGLAKALNDAARPEWEDEPHFRSVSFEHDGATVHSIAFPFVQPSWSVHDGTLHFGIAPQAVTSAIDYANDGGDSILENENFQAMRERLGEGDTNAIEFLDLPRSVQSTYGTALLLGQLASSVGIAMNPEDDGQAIALLPTLGRLLPHIEPAGQRAWVDDAGWHARLVSPFPGSTLLGYEGVASPSIGALSIGTLLPALGAARESARQVQSMSQVRQIVLGVHIYAADHDDELPADLFDLYGPYVTEADIFVNANAADMPRTVQQDDEQAQVAWLREHSSYVLIQDELPERLAEVERPSSTIILFERPDHAAGDRIAVGFADGHAENLPIQDARARVLEQTGETLEALLERQQTYSDDSDDDDDDG